MNTLTLPFTSEELPERAGGSEYNRVHFSSESHVWETPCEVFRKYDDRFNFTLDACALPENAKCLRYFSPEDDGLTQEWRGVVWCNPPYGRNILPRWIKKGYQSACSGATVVMLLPANTDTKWFHDFCIRGEVCFLQGRIRFSESKNTAPFASMIVVFYPPKEAKGQRVTHATRPA